jgi:HEAT repeat protein
MLVDQLRTKATSIDDPVLRRTYDDIITKLIALKIDSEDELLNALTGPADAVLTASWVAGELSVDGAVPLLWNVIETRPEHAIEASKAIVKLRRATSTDAVSFAKLLQSATAHPNVRVAAAHALGQISSDVGVAALVAALGNRAERADIRGHCAEALGNLRARSAFGVLINGLRDDNAEVRFWSAYALGQLGDSRAASALKEVAEHDRGHVEGLGSVREEASEALSMLRSE